MSSIAAWFLLCWATRLSDCTGLLLLLLQRGKASREGWGRNGVPSLHGTELRTPYPGAELEPCSPPSAPQAPSSALFANNAVHPKIAFELECFGVEYRVQLVFFQGVEQQLFFFWGALPQFFFLHCCFPGCRSGGRRFFAGVL